MIVRTLERRFAVIQVLHRTEQTEILVCRDLEENTSALYALARFTDPALSRNLLPMLMKQQENAAFEDYLGLFSQDGDLYARFRYTDAPTLAERLVQGGDSLQARLLIGGNLVERMALLNMPPALQFEALRSRNLTVDDSLKVSFNYILDPMAASSNVDMGFICARTEEILRELFAQELSAKSAPELEEYLAALSRAEYRSYLELYGGYDRVRKALDGRVSKGEAEPQTWLFRIWEKMKNLRPYVMPVLSGLVLVAAFCYLIYTLLVPAVPKGTPVIFDSIGTVSIQSPGQTQTPQTSEPQASEPQASEPQASEPQVSGPQTSEPQASGPEISAPELPVSQG